MNLYFTKHLFHFGLVTFCICSGIDTPDEISDDGINAFYDAKRTSPEDMIKDTFVATLQVEDSR